MTLQLVTERYASDERLEITAGTDITAGDPQDVGGGLIGIPANDIASGDTDEVDINGRFRAWSVAGESWAVGQQIGWDADGDPLNGTAGVGAYTNNESNWDYPVGSCVEAKASNDEMGVILLNVMLEGSIAGALGNEIADPGDAGAVPVTATGHVNIVTAGAETRTIAAPTQIGQRLLLSMQTDGGNAVVTVATTVNQAGNNTLTFDDAGDSILLIAKKNGSNVRWAAGLSDGVGLSTV